MFSFLGNLNSNVPHSLVWSGSDFHNTEICKPFDAVDHEVLLIKFQYAGIALETSRTGVESWKFASSINPLNFWSWDNKLIQLNMVHSL